LRRCTRWFARVGAIALAGRHVFLKSTSRPDEVRDCSMIDLEAALGEFGDRSSKAKSPALACSSNRGARPKMPSAGSRLSTQKQRCSNATLRSHASAASRQSPCADAHAESRRGFCLDAFSLCEPASTPDHVRGRPRITSGAGPGSRPGQAPDHVRGRPRIRSAAGPGSGPGAGLRSKTLWRHDSAPASTAATPRARRSVEGSASTPAPDSMLNPDKPDFGNPRSKRPGA
jgi:hypothetical protein